MSNVEEMKMKRKFHFRRNKKDARKQKLAEMKK